MIRLRRNLIEESNKRLIKKLLIMNLIVIVCFIILLVVGISAMQKKIDIVKDTRTFENLLDDRNLTLKCVEYTQKEALRYNNTYEWNTYVINLTSGRSQVITGYYSELSEERGSAYSIQGRAGMTYLKSTTAALAMVDDKCIRYELVAK